MPAFTKVAYPSGNAAAFSQTEIVIAPIPGCTNLMEDNLALNNASNSVQWWNYNTMSSQTYTVGQTFASTGPYSANVAAANSFSDYGRQTWVDPDRQYGHDGHYRLSVPIEGWDSIPAESSVKGLVIYMVYADSGDSAAGAWSYNWYNRSYFGHQDAGKIQLVKFGGVAGKEISIPWPEGPTGPVTGEEVRGHFKWTEVTVGSSTSLTAFFTAGFTVSDIASGLSLYIDAHSPRADTWSGLTSPHRLWIDYIKCTLYFQTAWYYGTCGVPKGFQKKMNGIELSGVAGANGMAREA